MNNLIKVAYLKGANAALTDLGLSKTAWFGQNLLKSVGGAVENGARAFGASGPALETAGASLGLRGRLSSGAHSIAEWAAAHPELAGGAAIGAGALGAGAAGYALAPDQKPWYHFGQ